MEVPAWFFFLGGGGGKWGQDIFQGGKTLKKSLVLIISGGKTLKKSSALTTLYMKLTIFSWFHRKLGENWGGGAFSPLPTPGATTAS